MFQISDDQGKTWRCVELPNSRGRVHANVVELSPGHLVAFLRSREADWVYRSEYLDNGDTWTSPLPTPLPNNNSSISALKLQSGRIAIAYNPTQCPGDKPGMAVWPGLRCPVAVALSEDEGHTFPLIRMMELGEGFAGVENRCNNVSMSTPCLIQARTVPCIWPLPTKTVGGSNGCRSGRRTFWEKNGNVPPSTTPRFLRAEFPKNVYQGGTCKKRMVFPIDFCAFM